MFDLDKLASEFGLCISYCEHGGICNLNKDHNGLHSSGFCEWSDKMAISRQEADIRLYATAPEFMSLWNLIVKNPDKDN